MARRFTLRTSHLLMWSSPLLLLVLVFTLNSRPLHPSTGTTSTTSRVSTTTSTAPRTTIPTTTTEVTTTTSAPTTTSATTTTTSSPANSSAATTTSVVPGALVASGSLSLSQPNAVEPLRGPGAWVLRSSHNVSSSLLCGPRDEVVTSIIRLAAGQNCQLNIIVDTGVRTTWTLNTVR